MAEDYRYEKDEDGDPLTASKFDWVAKGYDGFLGFGSGDQGCCEDCICDDDCYAPNAIGNLHGSPMKISATHIDQRLGKRVYTLSYTGNAEWTVGALREAGLIDGVIPSPNPDVTPDRTSLYFADAVLNGYNIVNANTLGYATDKHRDTEYFLNFNAGSPASVPLQSEMSMGFVTEVIFDPDTNHPDHPWRISSDLASSNLLSSHYDITKYPSAFCVQQAEYAWEGSDQTGYFFRSYTNRFYCRLVHTYLPLEGRTDSRYETEEQAEENRYTYIEVGFVETGQSDIIRKCFSHFTTNLTVSSHEHMAKNIKTINGNEDSMTISDGLIEATWYEYNDVDTGSYLGTIENISENLTVEAIQNTERKFRIELSPDQFRFKRVHQIPITVYWGINRTGSNIRLKLTNAIFLDNSPTHLTYAESTGGGLGELINNSESENKPSVQQMVSEASFKEPVSPEYFQTTIQDGPVTRVVARARFTLAMKPTFVTGLGGDSNIGLLVESDISKLPDEDDLEDVIYIVFGTPESIPIQEYFYATAKENYGLSAKFQFSEGKVTQVPV
jgi:hypothetical protein